MSNKPLNEFIKIVLSDSFDLLSKITKLEKTINDSTKEETIYYVKEKNNILTYSIPAPGLNKDLISVGKSEYGIIINSNVDSLELGVNNINLILNPPNEYLNGDIHVYINDGLLTINLIKKI